MQCAARLLLFTETGPESIPNVVDKTLTERQWLLTISVCNFTWSK